MLRTGNSQNTPECPTNIKTHGTSQIIREMQVETDHLLPGRLAVIKN